MTLVKYILLMFQIIACATCSTTTTRSKRSADGFSIFGINPFSVPKRAQQSVSDIGQFLTSPLHRHRNEENVYKSVVYNDERNPYVIPTNALSIQNQYVKANTEKSFSGHFTKPNTLEEHIESKNKAIKAEEANNKPEKDINVHSHNENNKNNEINIISDPSDQFFGPDQELINSIFRTTTEDSVDYTTVTFDYNNTTTDELLRIPAAAVATLLGK